MPHPQQTLCTRDQTYDVISVIWHALQGIENCRTYLHGAGQGDARDFFHAAVHLQQELAEQGKHVLLEALEAAEGRGGKVAFRADDDLENQIGSATRR